MKKHSSGAEFHDFETAPIFVGRYIAPVRREKDAEGAATDESKRAGAIIGYAFEDMVKEEETIIGNSHMIAKAVSGADAGTVFRIVFKGKGETSKGQPINRFAIDQAESEDDEAELLQSVSGK